MASIKYDSKRFTSDLERDIKKSVQEDIQRHPAKILNDHIGKRIDAHCTCGGTEAEVLANGRVRCVKCGTVSTPKINVDWRKS